MELDAQALEIGDRGGLRGAVGSAARQTAKARNARDTDQGAARPGAQGLDERLKRRDHTEDVGAHDGPEHGEVFRVFGQRARSDAGVRDDDVRDAESDRKSTRLNSSNMS